MKMLWIMHTQQYLYITLQLPICVSPVPQEEAALEPAQARRRFSQPAREEGHPQMLEVFLACFLIIHYLVPHNTLNERFGALKWKASGSRAQGKTPWLTLTQELEGTWSKPREAWSWHLADCSAPSPSVSLLTRGSTNCTQELNPEQAWKPSAALMLPFKPQERELESKGMGTRAWI